MVHIIDVKQNTWMNAYGGGVHTHRSQLENTVDISEEFFFLFGSQRRCPKFLKAKRAPSFDGFDILDGSSANATRLALASREISM